MTKFRDPAKVNGVSSVLCNKQATLKVGQNWRVAQLKWRLTFSSHLHPSQLRTAESKYQVRKPVATRVTEKLSTQTLLWRAMEHSRGGIRWQLVWTYRSHFFFFLSWKQQRHFSVQDANTNSETSRHYLTSSKLPFNWLTKSVLILHSEKLVWRITVAVVFEWQVHIGNFKPFSLLPLNMHVLVLTGTDLVQTSQHFCGTEIWERYPVQTTLPVLWTNRALRSRFRSHA